MLAIFWKASVHSWKRQKRMEQTFSPEDRRLVEGKRRMPQWLVFAVLCLVVTAAGSLAGYAIWQLSGQP